MSATPFKVDDEVHTAYGIGVITKYREEDEMYEILLKKWTLATKKSPVLYAKGENITTFSRHLFESGTKRAFENKKLGADLYSKGLYEKAAEKYYECMNNIRGLDENNENLLNNADKAVIFEITVPVHNNIAVCLMNLKSYKDASLFATSAYNLIMALHAKLPGSLVWEELLKRGNMTEDKVFKDMRCKSLRYMGECAYYLQNYEGAINDLKLAFELASSNTDKEKITEKLGSAKLLHAKVLKKEKSMWSKAFEANSKGSESNPSSVPSSPKKGDKKPSDILGLTDFFKFDPNYSKKGTIPKDDSNFSLSSFINMQYLPIILTGVVGCGVIGYMLFSTNKNKLKR